MDGGALSGGEGGAEPSVGARDDGGGVSVERGRVVVRERGWEEGMKDDEEDVGLAGSGTVFVEGEEEGVQEGRVGGGREGDTVALAVREDCRVEEQGVGQLARCRAGSGGGEV